MNINHFTLRPLTRNELGLAIDWAAAEGWNPGLQDAEVFGCAGMYSADPPPTNWDRTFGITTFELG